MLIEYKVFSIKKSCQFYIKHLNSFLNKYRYAWSSHSVNIPRNVVIVSLSFVWLCSTEFGKIRYQEILQSSENYAESETWFIMHHKNQQSDSYRNHNINQCKFCDSQTNWPDMKQSRKQIYTISVIHPFANHPTTIIPRMLYKDYPDTPDSKVHEANMETTWVLPAPGGPHVG